MKIKASCDSVKKGMKISKELIFEMNLSELVSCKSIKTVVKTIRNKAEGLGILNREEIRSATFTDLELIDNWKKYRKATKELDTILNLVLSRWTLGETHGISHWKRVFENGMKLMTEETDPVVLQYFAYLHDSCREDDGEDRLHGERAAEWIEIIRPTHLKQLTEEQFLLLKEACRLHTVVDKTGNPTIDACFDADRLDLCRVGIKPDPARMATRKGAELASMITDKKMNELFYPSSAR